MRLFICALWSPAGKGLASWLSFMVSNCEFVTFPFASCVKCGTLLYRFMIFAPLLTFPKANNAEPDQTPHNAVSYLVLLSMSHKLEAMLILIKWKLSLYEKTGS